MALLQIDVKADDVLFSNLRACGAVATASSEERAEELDLGGQGFSVAFDPLDGSSIVGANFAVGAIFGIWEGPGLLGRTGAEQVAAAYAVYGPRTSLVLARPGAVHLLFSYISAMAHFSALARDMPPARGSDQLIDVADLAGTKDGFTVEELMLTNGKWSVSCEDIRVGEKKVGAPTLSNLGLSNQWPGRSITRASLASHNSAQCRCLLQRI